jgi:hypothetical protein
MGNISNMIVSERYDWQENCNLETRAQHKAARTFRVICKIQRQVIGTDLVVLRVSGQLTGEDVDTLRALLEEERSTALILDLKDVRFVDEEAVKLLAIHESNGAKINNCPRYIREWIKGESEAT